MPILPRLYVSRQYIHCSFVQINNFDIDYYIELSPDIEIIIGTLKLSKRCLAKLPQTFNLTRGSNSYRVESKIRMRWRFNRGKHFRQLKSFGLKKALHWFKGITVAQAARSLPLALPNYSQPSQD